MVVTNHAYKRSLERSGLNRRATERMLNKIWDQGISAEETTGKIKQWLDTVQERSLSDLNKILLYGDKAYLFHDDILITILQVPSVCMKTLNSIRQKARTSF